MPDQSELLTTDELATYLKVPVDTLYEWRYQRKGPPASKVGKVLRYRRADVDRWLEEQKVS